MRDALGRRFWTVWSASAISYVGDGLYIGALPLLAASLTRDPRLVSLVDAVGGLGWLLLGLVSGVVIDRVDRLRLMWQVDLLRGLITMVFAGLVLTGNATIALMYVTAFLLGVVKPFFGNASSTIIPTLVDRHHLDRANSLSQLVLVFGSNLVGPPLGALLFVVSTGAPFVLDAASFVVGALLLAVVARQPSRPRKETTPEPLRRQLRAGVDYLLRAPILRAQSVTVAAINAVTGGMIAILVLYLLEVLHLSQAIYGWLVCAFAVGGILGALLVPRLTRLVGPGAAAGGATVGFGMSSLLIGLTQSLAATVSALVLAGVSSVVWNVVTISYRQRTVPEEMLGRVTSTYRMAAFIAMPLGAAGAGLVAHHIGLGNTYTLGGLFLLMVAAFATPTLRRMPHAREPTHPGASSPEVSLPPDAEHGQHG